jgi:hypothetical protein
MSLDKAIEHGKEKRKPYYRAGRFDPTCRPNGGCPYCKNSREHKHKKKKCACKAQVDDVYLVDEIDKSIQEFWENNHNYEHIEDGTQKEDIDRISDQGTA